MAPRLWQTARTRFWKEIPASNRRNMPQVDARQRGRFAFPIYSE